MASDPAEAYAEVAEAAWRSVLDQVRWDDGPWVPVSVTGAGATEPGWDRDGLHSGVAGLAYRLQARIPTLTECTFFDGLVSTLGALVALETSSGEAAVARLAALEEPDGWPQTVLTSPPGPRTPASTT